LLFAMVDTHQPGDPTPGGNPTVGWPQWPARHPQHLRTIGRSRRPCGVRPLGDSYVAEPALAPLRLPRRSKPSASNQTCGGPLTVAPGRIHSALPGTGAGDETPATTRPRGSTTRWSGRSPTASPSPWPLSATSRKPRAGCPGRTAGFGHGSGELAVLADCLWDAAAKVNHW